ncbi:MAG: NAD(P)/FAD-dependent oxidoreductase [Syntrophobacteraceae bacterium]|nr:NAD(P)/FAD-dependent oxidoreductase [Syntrophobacteraceae bacterium]
MQKDVIIIGAGASGLMCALEAANRGRSVLVLDHSPKAARKILVSGGGRCNFSNRIMGPEYFISQNPNFVTSALSRFTPSDFISLLEGHGIEYQEREEGRLFCTGNSSQIVDLLFSECCRAAVGFRLNCAVSGLSNTDGFEVETDQGVFKSHSLVIATGGLSYPQLGAGNFGYLAAKQFGMRVTKLLPALTPVRFSAEDAPVFAGLSGVSINCTVSTGATSFTGNLLFTHTGVSGPAILQISSYWDRQSSLSVDLLPELDIYSLLIEKRRSKILLSTILDQHLPKRFVKLWCDLQGAPKPLNQYSTEEIASIARSLHDWPLRAEGAEGFNKAEVTLGGVDTVDLSSRTMESKKAPGLYFVGEVIDVTGRLGGYNLHWAWASGHAAGQFA